MKTGILRITALAVLSCSFLTLSLNAQAGRIGGIVTDQSNGAPIEDARVQLVGTSLIETTNREGRFLFRSVAPGTYQVRVIYVGYTSETKPVTVGANETAAVDFALASVPITLDEIVVTATGEQRKLEVPNVVATIKASERDRSGAGHRPEFAHQRPRRRGSGTEEWRRHRNRKPAQDPGPNSASLSNEPLYYIDGIRMESSPIATSIDFSGGVEGGTPSAINDINPEDIESIEIVKGPAAATLYGIQARTGSSGSSPSGEPPGRPRWNFYTELGAVSDHNTYPLNCFGRDSTGSGYDGFCIVQYELDGLCTQTSRGASTARWRIPAPGRSRPVSGSSMGAACPAAVSLLTYYLSASYESEDGVFRLPKFEEDSIRQSEGSVPTSQIRPNALQKLALRANVGANCRQQRRTDRHDRVHLQQYPVRRERQQLPQHHRKRGSKLQPAGIQSRLVPHSGRVVCRAVHPGRRAFTGGLTSNWQTLPWLRPGRPSGYDIVNRADVQFFPTGKVADFLDNLDGVRVVNRFQISQTSVDLGATARFALSPAINSKTSIGGQWFRD